MAKNRYQLFAGIFYWISFSFRFYYNTWIWICKDIRENKCETIHEKCGLLSKQMENPLKIVAWMLACGKNSNFCH